MARAIESYAPIGDGRTVALIGLNGRIDWLPLPNLTNVPVFAHLLDDETGGSFTLAPDLPESQYRAERRYVPNTNVLETTFTTAEGAVRVTDALVSGVAGRLPWAELARRVDGLSGTVPMRWAVRPGTSLQTAAPWVEPTAHGHVVRSGATAFTVVGMDHGPADPEVDGEQGPELAGAFAARAGSRHLVALAATHDEPLHFPTPENVDAGIDRTVENWCHWSRVFSYDGPYAEAMQRNALALKLLIYSPTGAIAAAATTSLPENPEGGKNWDYRLAWVRDLAYTAQALVRFGLREETQAALSWMLQMIRKRGPELHVMYTLDGELVPEPHAYHVRGWRGIGPVVSGNPASGQLQLGVYGDLIAICRTYVDAGNVLDVDTARMLAGVADRTCDLWRNPDSGMWELGTDRHYISSKMGCWKALDDAAALAEAGSIPGSAERWRAERDRIRQWIDAHGWSEERRSYLFYAGGDELDASVLLHAPTGFDRGERMSATIDALTAELGAGPLLYRYSGAEREEHTFVACAFWRVEALACVGRHEEALELMDALVGHANDVGIYAEMIDAATGSAWGNTPQALSHLAFLGAVMTIRDVVAADLLDGR
ncbi:Glucoamylase (glucan-1,4-alpha-glucosidase), GH15 family [Leucobacter chromiiresistens]|uniref:Glucoamylase (Glucan-1,4-alpha-glucosidase), GH15 family n=1 Tax=Leucobacter chromiiresistens TaxID=1079994 RepID=A0A1H0YM15_9MICO|nr:glycoside hydrolase family 15 protein [Leucobacter chromiiresistens]SDQ16120.1 Glucoamylase (glucan-1,4-alpha-glucosidase), GH15 family [Leucobacter chromiiresistens]